MEVFAQVAIFSFNEVFNINSEEAQRHIKLLETSEIPTLGDNSKTNISIQNACALLFRRV